MRAWGVPDSNHVGQDRDHRCRWAAGQLFGGPGRSSGPRVLALTSSQWDITDPAAAERIVESGDVVVNCAAYTNVDGAESDEASGIRGQCRRARKHRARLRARRRPADPRLHRLRVQRRVPVIRAAPYEPGDETAPLGVYGRSKLAGEAGRAGGAAGGRRGAHRLGLHRRHRQGLRRRHARGWPPATARSRWSTTRPGRRPTSPTWPPRCCRWPTTACPGRMLHAANEGAVSRFGQARAVFEECGADPARVRPVSTATDSRGRRRGRPTPRCRAGSRPRRA